MTTPECKGGPKNYISTGISKNLLTPCRRIGLSRTKKTPKPDILKKEIASPLFDSHKDVIALSTKPKDELHNTPIRGSAAKPERERKVSVPQKEFDGSLLDVDTLANGIKANEEVDNTPKGYLTAKPSRKQKQIIIGKNVGCTKNKPTEEALECNSKIIKEKCEVPSAGISLKKDSKLPSSLNTNTQDVHDIIEKNSETDSPASSPLISQVIVQVHHPVEKTNINLNQTEEFQDLSIPKKKKRLNFSHCELPIKTADTESYSSQSSSEYNSNVAPFKENYENSPLLTKTKKRKLRLDSSDFESEESVDLIKSENNSKSKMQNKFTTKEVLKSNINNCTKDSTLTRFNTEDYLNAYAKNPKRFQKCLDMGSSCSSLNDDNDDDFQDFVPSIKLKVKNKDSTRKERVKNYMAVICTPTDPTEKNSKGIQKSYNAISESKCNNKLTISLERLSPKSVKQQQKNDKPENFNSTSKKKILGSTTGSTKTFENYSDDDMFTTSPESDREQRKNLLLLISNAEKEVKQREETLEKLKQAQVYKKMHSPEKLKLSSKRWMEGCRSGLNDLLIKMQELGPMEMDTLLKNLRIPNNIVEALKL